MPRTCRTLVTTAVLCAVVFLAGGNAYAQTPDCLPGIDAAFSTHAQYAQLFTAIVNGGAPLFNGLVNLADQPTYATLLASAHTLAATIPNGRVVMTVPDGTVVLDTAKPDDPTNTLASGNSYQHFQNKTVNENHNSRIAILSAQLYPCGFGIETKFSTTTLQRDIYFAVRVGNHLDNFGTLRLNTTVASAAPTPAVPSTLLPQSPGATH